ncbi:hypothetical protein M408DRAFT_328945 [Serendipita vermifera MAFF 305830]|uniref:Uncharacterized protein n=1 Tax=Serendipita vermifera MAFF 305830 TaxID=933852 RepID=A0A0C2WT28_SERVB|nr:hypothetical protein M408DRAFT_328945 [Serendipita vermifera MAFF 305830]
MLALDVEPSIESNQTAAYYTYPYFAQRPGNSARLIDEAELDPRSWSLDPFIDLYSQPLP